MCKKKLILFLVVLSLLTGCMTATNHQQNLLSTKEREMTLGIVQKEIYVGMSQSDLAIALGSPNIVTKSDDKETWIYDKIATEASYSQSSVSIGGIASGGATLVLSLLGGYSKEAGAHSTTQKTLTVVIKFDKNNKIESFSYHASKF